MSLQFDPFSLTTGFAQNLGGAVLANTEEFLSFQFDHTQALITRSSKQLRAIFPESSHVDDSARWPDVMQKSIDGANTLIRDSFVSAIDYQMEIFRMLQKQAAEIQKVISESVHEQLAAIDPTTTQVKQGSKTNAFAKKLAA